MERQPSLTDKRLQILTGIQTLIGSLSRLVSQRCLNEELPSLVTRQNGVHKVSVVELRVLQLESKVLAVHVVHENVHFLPDYRLTNRATQRNLSNVVEHIIVAGQVKLVVHEQNVHLLVRLNGSLHAVVQQVRSTEVVDQTPVSVTKREARNERAVFVVVGIGIPGTIPEQSGESRRPRHISERVVQCSRPESGLNVFT